MRGKSRTVRDDGVLTRSQESGEQAMTLCDGYRRAAVHAAMHPVELATCAQASELSGSDAEGASALSGDEAVRCGEMGSQESVDAE